jgi:hypothetical protein
MPADLGRIAGPHDSLELAIALCSGTHVGVVYPDGGSLQLLHFAFMHDLREENFAAWRGRYACVVPDFLPAILMSLAGFFRRIASVRSNRNTIPYNLQPDTGADFDPDTGEFIAGPGGGGFSCATFVVHAFRRAGHPIVNTDNWPSGRPADRARQEYLIRRLKVEGFADWADRLAMDELGCARIAPEEVAGACLEDVPPASFEQCEPNGKLLLHVLTWQSERYH